METHILFRHRHLSSPNTCSWYSRSSELLGRQRFGHNLTVIGYVTSLNFSLLTQQKRGGITCYQERRLHKQHFPGEVTIQSYLSPTVSETQKMRSPQDPSLKHDSGSCLRASREGGVHHNENLFTERNGRVSSYQSLHQSDEHILSL